MKIRILFSFLFLVSFCNITLAQKGNIRGNVYDKDTGEPIMFGNVYISGTTIGTTTDIDGFYTLPNLDAGNYTVVASNVGYDSSAVDIKIPGNGIFYQSFYLLEGVSLETVTVSGKKEQARSDVKVSQVTVTPKQIQSLPSTGGEADIAQYLPVLPGIIFTGDQGGQLYIRGGSPVQNKIMLDGMTLYNPFHSIGFFSVFETETIKSVDVLTGGFNAEYGGRISAVVDIKTRDGDKKRFGGVVSANPFQSKLLIEGPIKKLKEDGGGSASFILTGKRSYIDETSKSLYSYATDNDSIGLPYNFTDVYGKLSFNSSNGSKLNLFGFNFEDNFNEPGVAALGWKAGGAGLNFKLVPPSSSVIVGGTLSYSSYKVDLDEGIDKPRSSSINNFAAILDFSIFGKDSELKYGIEFSGYNTKFEFVNFRDFTFEQEDNTTEIGAFVKYKKKFGESLVIEPSMRLMYYASLSDFSLEPRLGLKYNATDNLRFKLAGGLYSQNLISTVNEQDIVNLFVGFLTAPGEEIQYLNDPERTTDHRLQKAYHAIVGAEIDLSKKVELNVEPYYKNFTQLIGINRNKLLGSDKNYTSETGEAYGIDFSLKYETRKTYVWMTYSLGYVNRFDGDQVYPTHFDRRHNVNTLITYDFGPSNSWQVSGRFNFGTGFPFSLTQGVYGQPNIDDISFDPSTSNGDLAVILSDERNSGRLSDYARLDLSIKKTFTFNKHSDLVLTAGVTNALSRENIFFFDRLENERVNQLPILPSFGAIYRF